MKARKILFIAWDAPHTRYLEGLFAPIFEKLAQLHHYEIHVMQFSWAQQREVDRLKNLCEAKGLYYVHVPVVIKPHPFIGKYITLLRGSSIIKRYISLHKIDIVMPRSTMPAKMLLSLSDKDRSFKIVFDADGLPIEERVDFAGLKKGSMRYRALKRIERKTLYLADRVLTRTQRAVDLLRTQHGVERKKFFIVENGRDPQQFRRQNTARINSIKQKLSIPAAALVLVYCGSLGPQYGIDEMLCIQKHLIDRGCLSYLLLIATNPGYVENGAILNVPNVIVIQVSFQEVPDYLSVADIGLAIRQPSFSMQGVAPVKLGEYLLMGLPTIASTGIGDTAEMLAEKDFVFLLPDHQPDALTNAAGWVVRVAKKEDMKVAARQFGEQYFGLGAAVESYHHALRDL